MSAMSDLHADAARVERLTNSTMSEDLRDEGREVASLVANLRNLCGDDEQAFLDTLEGEVDNFEAARRVVRWMHEQDAAEGSCKSLAETYRARANMFGHRVERARASLVDFLNEVGVRSMPLPEATITVKAGVRALVGDADVANLPEQFVRVKREPNRSAIKAAIEAGQTVPGFSLSNAAPSLQVRSSGQPPKEHA